MGDLKTMTGTGHCSAPQHSPVAPDKDWISPEEQRRLAIGPDFDPDYSKKLNAFFEEKFGPLGDFQLVGST
jgi:hypothetical protein